MRSRYTAFALHEVDYLIETHHPDTRGAVNRDDVRRWSEGTRWLGLEILRTKDGQPGDDQGWVEFIARYAENGETKAHDELSLFQRHQGRWFFHSERITPGRYEYGVPTRAVVAGWVQKYGWGISA